MALVYFISGYKFNDDQCKLLKWFPSEHWSLMSYSKCDLLGAWRSSTWTCSLVGGSDLICSLPCFCRSASEGPRPSSWDHCACSPQTAASLWYTSATATQRIWHHVGEDRKEGVITPQWHTFTVIFKRSLCLTACLFLGYREVDWSSTWLF